jgi:hypothetical protein
MSTKRRRIVDDDDADGEDDDPGNATSTVMRMLRHTKKSSSTLVKADKTEGTKGAVGMKRSTPIPRNDEIPKKAKVTDEKDGKPSRLTQSMLPLPATSLLLQPPASSSVSSVATTGAAVPVANTTGINENARRYGKPNNNNNARQPDMRRTRLSPVRMDSLDSTPQSQQPPPQQQKSQQQQQQQQQSQLRDEERRVLSTLRTLCSKVHLKLLPTDDFLSGSSHSRWRCRDNFRSECRR